MKEQQNRLFLWSPYPPEKDRLLLPIFDEAVRMGKSLGRPFEEREVLDQEWGERYGLMLQMDPRFYAVQAKPGAAGSESGCRTLSLDHQRKPSTG